MIRMASDSKQRVFQFCDAVIVIILIASTATAQNAPAKLQSSGTFAQSSTLSLDDLFHLNSAGEVKIGADGKHLFYVRSVADIMSDSVNDELWLVDTTTRDQRSLTTKSFSSEQWALDSQRIAYFSHGVGDSTDLLVQQIMSGDVSTLAHLSGTPSNLCWSPDGRWIAFSMFIEETIETPAALIDKPQGAEWAKPLKYIDAVHYRSDGGGYSKQGRSHLYVISSGGGPLRQVTHDLYDERSRPSWTPDSRKLVFSSNHSYDPERDPYDNTDIFSLELDNLRVTRLTNRVGPDEHPLVSPDGKHVAYLGHDETLRGIEFFKLYLMNIDGTNKQNLSVQIDQNISYPHWAHDSKSVYAEYDDHAVSTVARFDLDGNAVVVARDLDGNDFSVSDAGVLAYSRGAFDHPADVALQSADGEFERVTNLNATILGHKKLGILLPLDVFSSYDHLPIQAWAITPPGYDSTHSYPTILSIHGGPFGSYDPQWSSDFQILAAAGYVVVFGNPRGSLSYGYNFASKINHDFPSHDYDDLMTVVDEAIRKGIADPNRLFVTGGSAGGELTAWIVGKTRRFRAAAVEKPVINETSDLLETDQYIGGPQFDFGKFPWQDNTLFWVHSPLSLVGNVKTPTLLIVGDQDFRTPLAESEQYYAALQSQGVATALILVPGASHESLLSRPSQHAEELAAILQWFRKHSSQ